MNHFVSEKDQYTHVYILFFFLKLRCPLYLNHLSTFELLYVTELSSFAHQFAPLHSDSALCVCVCGDETQEKASKCEGDQSRLSPEGAPQTLSFLPSMVVISASLPMVKELVTVFPGVLEVTTKSLPLCLISVIGLMSLAILMTSSGSSGVKNKFTFMTFIHWQIMARPGSGGMSYPWPWGTPRSSPGRKPAMFRWSPCWILLNRGGLEAVTAVWSSTQCEGCDQGGSGSYRRTGQGPGCV